MAGSGSIGGVGVDASVCHLWTERDGLAVRLQAFNDPEKAFRAAGLSA